jgi:hypothetical protein
MAESPLQNDPNDFPVRRHLQELAQVLRRAHHLDPDARQQLIDLVGALSRDLNVDTLAPADKARVAESLADLLRAVREQEAVGPLRATRERLEAAVIEAEAEAPVAAGVVRRLLDTLANIGI